jgi:hypothetical protein
VAEAQDVTLWSIGRGTPKPYQESASKKESLSKFFAETVTGPDDQDISFLIVGRKGSGKSFADLSIAYSTACEIAEIMGGHWSDYYDLEANTAIIDPERANEIMGHQDRYAVKIYDDIGVGWGARDWQKDANKAKNDVFQINRVDNQVQLFSVPNQFLLDKVPRSLVSHYGETHMQFFRKGFITIKVFEPQTMFRESKIIQPYLVVNRNKFVMYAIPKPPAELAKRYKVMRREVTGRIVQMRKEKIAEDLGAGKKVREAGDVVRERVRNAITDMNEKDIPKAQALQMHNISLSQYQRYAAVERRGLAL